MLKTTSANRATKLKVIEDGKVVKNISNASINYGQDLVQLKKMIEIAIRLSPDDPIFIVEKLIITAGEGAEYEIDQKELELIQGTLFRSDASAPIGAKIQLTVHVKRQAQRSVSRGTATIRERMASTTPAKEELPPGSSKYENILRAPSPAPNRRTATPNKLRSVSRGRPTTPASTMRGPSPARFSRCSMSSNDSDNSSRVASRLRDALPEGFIGRVTSQDSIGSTRSEKFEPSIRVPSMEVKSVTSESSLPPASASKLPAPAPAPQAVVQSLVPPPAPVTEVKPVAVNTVTTNEPVNEKKTPAKSKRLSSVFDLSEETIEQSIHQTWKEVEVDNALGVKTPPRSFLGPFTYYSPMMSPADNNNKISTVTNNTTTEEIQPVIESVEVPVAEVQPAVDETPASTEETLNTSVQEFGETKDSVENADISVDMSVENNENDGNGDNSSKTTATTANNAANANGTPKKAPKTLDKPKKSFIQSNVNSASKPRNASAAASRLLGSSSVVRPVFPDGKTLGESSVSYDNSLRSYTGAHRLTHSEMKKSLAGGNKNDFSPVKGHRRTSSFHKEHPKDGEGRPSIGTLTAQWEFMRTNFVNNSDEELEWLMVSKKVGAYNYAHKKLEMAEDKYFKSLYEIDLYENRLQYFTPTLTAKFPTLLQDLSNYYSSIMAQPKDEITGNLITNAYQKLCTYCKEMGNFGGAAGEGGNNSNDIFAIFPNKFNQSLTALLNQSLTENNDKFKIVRKARDLYDVYTSDIIIAQNKLINARKDSEDALKNIEKWTKREVETEEYPSIMKQQEQAFMDKEFDENYKSLQIMRSYFPDPSRTTDNKSINEMTIIELQQYYTQLNGYISYELANELKSNKFLQWILTHTDDIIYANFLNGDKKSYFENLESYDLIELRAIAMILPMKFENDNDNKKMEWRNRFMTRLKMLVSQYHGEKVKGCWDGINNCRSMVTLPALKPDQLRRSIYYYRTKEQSDVKLKQYNDKIALLEKKKKQLEQAEIEAKEAKEEYNTVLQESRDPDFLELYGPDKLTSVKDLAKTELNNAEKKRKTLAQDVARIQKSMDETPMTRDQFIEKEKELEDFLKQKKGIDWTVPGTAPVLTEGVFDPDRVIEKQVKAAAKFLSAEEEAEQRKQELLSFKSRSTTAASIDTESVDAEGGAALSIPHSNSISQSLDEMLTSQNEILNTLTNTDSNATTAAPVPPSPVTVNPFTSPVRRSSILASTNPELINTLNKMLSGAANPETPNGSSVLRPKSMNRRSTLGAMFNRAASSSSTDEASENNSSSINQQPKEKKTTKSKLLKRLLQPFGSQEESSSENSNPNKAMARPPMSFLDQIKSRAGGKISPPSTEETSDAPAAVMKPRNPLMAALGGGGGGMSFLDQIKARCKVQE